MTSTSLLGEISRDLSSVESELVKYARQSNTLLGESSEHLIRAGGKRLRPAFVLLSGKFFNYDPDRLVPLAVAVELIHMATLVHDDVIDCASLRRGIPTVRARWGDQVAIYTGDYLFAQALCLVAKYGNEQITRILSEVSLRMCEGEIEQIETSGNLDLTLRSYLRRNKRKTALLFSTCCLIGALASGAPEFAVRSLKYYGYYLGMAFQITDDVLDFTSSEEVFGKPVCSDLRQGIITLPVIFALRDPCIGRTLREILVKEEKSESDWKEALRLIEVSGALEEAQELGNRYLEKAKKQLEVLPNSPPRQTLAEVADFIGVRKF
ncbi:MAG: Heptaprenyl diphosphate synthase component 2 [Thermoanaerobacterales bacterium 50_218]|nr:MAG: Heptaprenyl diphosphate synthase component 2 [Thermoanaerobacterales bacterium 50_218]HAA89509.1 heptaprenyl diphosphate synthase [Peptococcaceae bacterium]